MSLRNDIIAVRVELERIERDLAALERRAVSRNAAHLISRARGMARTSKTFLTESLGHQLDEAPRIATAPAMRAAGGGR